MNFTHESLSPNIHPISIHPLIHPSAHLPYLSPSLLPSLYLIYLPPFSITLIHLSTHPPNHPFFYLSTLPSLHAVIHLPVHPFILPFTGLSARAGSKSLKTLMLVLMLLCVLEIIPWETSPEPFASARALVWNPTSEVEHCFEKTKVVCLHSYMITSFYSMLWVWV